MNDLVIDLSHWNGDIDFEAMKASGIVGVIHKASEDEAIADDRYEDHRRDAEAAGLKWGAYHFLRPGDMREQAEFFVQQAGDCELYCADHEDEQVSLTSLKEFLQAIYHLTGKLAVIYSGNVIKDQVDGADEELAQHRLWLAHYTSGMPTWPSEIWDTWWLWQYTDTGTCPGVNGMCDVNRYNGTPEQLAAEWAGEEESAPPEPKPETVNVTIEIKVTAPPGVVVSVVTNEGELLAKATESGDIQMSTGATGFRTHRRPTRAFD